MLGNVWEYCADFIEDYATIPGINPDRQHHLALRGDARRRLDEQFCRVSMRQKADQSRHVRRRWLQGGG
jgi:formylglycine-generating enzyme required for sulfatase activity